MIDKVKIQILNMLATKFTKEQAKNFVANEMLIEYQGGIHCACSEVPKELEG